MTLGEKLKQLRQVRGLTLREVENDCDISNSYLNQLENDNIKDPSPRVLWSLAQFYNASYEEFMNLAGYVPPKTKGSDRLISGVALSALKELSDQEKEAVEALILHYRRLRNRKKSA